MTDEFCQQRLNEEYMALCRKLAEKLAAKRPSPLLRGELRTWACGIIRTIGWVNFLDDRSQSPHMKLPAILQPNHRSSGPTPVRRTWLYVFLPRSHLIFSISIPKLPRL